MRRVTRVLVSAAAVSGFGLLAAGPAAAAAEAPTTRATASSYGFAFADQPTNPSYTANPRMSANSTGATNTVTRIGTGDYEVRMPGLGASVGGNVQVSAYGEHSNRCKTSYWLPSGGAMVVGVACHNAAGAPADTQFTAQFHRGVNDPSKQSAYVLAHPAETGAPDPRYSFNSKGGSNHITKTGTGAWKVDFGPGFTKLGGVVHVTAYGFGNPFCKVRGWGVNTAEVRCFTATGQPKDTSWSLRYHDQHLPNGFADLGGHVWANKPANPAGVPYAPDARHSFNMQGGETNTVTRDAQGRYRVRFSRIPAFDQGNPMVTAHAADGVSCKVTELFSSGSSSLVEVDCRNAAGQLVDSSFTISQVTNL